MPFRQDDFEKPHDDEYPEPDTGEGSMVACRACGAMLDAEAQRCFACGHFVVDGDSKSWWVFLTGLVCLGLLGAIASRDRRDFRETAWQARASLLHVTIAILFLLALAAFGVWATGTGDVARVVYHWPGPMLLIASACSLVAALLSLVSLGIAPLVWRGGRRLDSWSSMQKLRFTGASLLFVIFSIVLLHWGALAPWLS